MMRALTGCISAAAFAILAACARTDAGITTSIKAKFAQDDLVKAHEINVSTHDRVVTLEGDVETVAAKEQAMRLARDTKGVREIVDQLRVDAAATSGELDEDVDVDVDLDEDIKGGAKATGRAVREGAEAAADAARKAGKAARDAVTDADRDSDKDGK